MGEEVQLDTRSGSARAVASASSATKGLLAACLASTAMLGQVAPATAATVQVKLIQTPAGKTYFDPIGVHIAPGDTVR